ncbi:MAG: DUF2892 domain-containing protein [Candidatus Omnitrophota bacterium]
MPDNTYENRIQQTTPESYTDEIRKKTEQSIEYYAHHPELIECRLKELGQEWDIERVLETNAASIVLAGTAFSILTNRKWLLLPLAVGGFLLQHTLQGWCPPLPVFRRIGIRTKEEIMKEKIALLAIKGHFDKIGQTQQGSQERLREALLTLK